jgi:tetrahydromethanopterin S-methyltransferase subunit H
MKGEFDHQEAERLIRKQEEFSDKTGHPHMIDVVGATPGALSRFIDLACGITQAPMLFDGVSS